MNSSSSSFSALRAFRLLRMFKIFKINELRVLMDSLIKTFKSILPFVICLSIIILILNLIALQFFAGEMKFNSNGDVDKINGESPRYNFDTFFTSLITVFSILVGDNWNSLMLDTIRSTSDVYAFYFIFVIVIGNIVMLQLLIAILIDNFTDSRKQSEKRLIIREIRKKVKAGLTVDIAIKRTLGEEIHNVMKEKDLYGKDMLKLKLDQMRQEIYSHITDEFEDKVNLPPQMHSFKNPLLSEGGSSSCQNKVEISSVQIQFKDLSRFDPESSQSVQLYKDSESHNICSEELNENKQITLQKYCDTENSCFNQNTQQIEKNNQSINDAFIVTRRDIKEGGKKERLTYDNSQKQNQLSKITENRENLQSFYSYSDFSMSKIDVFRDNNIRNFDEESKHKICDENYIVSKSKLQMKDISNEFNIQPPINDNPNDLNISHPLIQSKRNEVEFEEFKDEDFQSNPKLHSQSLIWKILNYMKDSSLFILHKNSWLRQTLLIITTSPDEMVIKEKAYSNPERYGIKDLSKSSIYSKMEINSLKIIVSKKEKLFATIFECAIICLIVLSCIVLVIYNPLSNPESILIKIMIFLDIVITFVFLVEAILKILACGFLFSSYPGVTPYIRNGWNIIDFCVVVFSVIDIYTEYLTSYDSISSLKSLKTLRAFRALRPLRMVNRNEGLRITVQALISSLPAMKNVLILCLLFLTAFAILGVGFFKGTFYYCNIDSSLLSYVNSRRDCLNFGGIWVNKDSNFDNVGNAMLTLFQLMTTEGWQDVMNSGVDSVDIEKQPVYNNNGFYSIYFILFMLYGAFVIINFFTATIVDNFNQIKEREEIGYGLLVTDSQRQWIEVQAICLRNKLIFKPRPPKNKIRQWIYRFATSKYFDYFISVIVLLNTVIMGIQYARMSKEYEFSLEIINYIFTGIYNIELVLKLIGIGFRYFTEMDFNTFDCICVILTDLSLILSFVLTDTLQSLVIFARGFRIIKIIRLTKSFGKRLINAMVYAIPQMKNIFMLLILLMFIYAILGINLFSTVMYKDTYTDQNNFRSLFNSLVLLIRCSTGEDWQKVMYELSSKSPYQNVECNNNQSYEDMQQNGVQGCGNAFAYIYFTSFFIIVSMIVMNLSIGVFVDAYEAAKKDESSIIKEDIISDIFLNLWSEYDPNASGWISIDELIFFLYELPEPLGYGKEIPELSDDYEFENLYQRRKRENSLKAEAFTNSANKKLCELNKISSIILNGEKYISHNEKGLIIKETKSISIVKDLEIPIYEGNQVHFKDVLTQLVNHVFQKNKEEYKPNHKVELKIFK